MLRQNFYIVTGKVLSVKKILFSIRLKPINLILIITVFFFYIINNTYLKKCTNGAIQYFLICYFNDLLCPIFFISYSNLLLITVNRELKELKYIFAFGFCSGLVWEFIAPLLKTSSVSDIMDLLFYVFGSFLYWCIYKIFG